MKPFNIIYHEYPVVSCSSPAQNSNTVNKCILAEIFGGIFNGADKIPENALTTIDKFFLVTFDVSQSNR